jgi:hypothetical protein
MLAFSLVSSAQLVLTDSMNLGEDRSSHNYQEYGATISMGNYDCSGDSAITVGGNSQFDSIVFELEVPPNTDEVVLSWNYAWFNAGTNEDQFTKMVVENTFEADMVSPGPNAIGSHPVSCELDSHRITFTGLAEHTADGSIKVKIYDPYDGFAGNGSICRVVVFAETPDDNNTGIQASLAAANLQAFPNPFDAQLTVQSTLVDLTDVRMQVVDVLGKQCDVRIQKRTKNELVIRTEGLSSGIYYLNLTDQMNGALLWSEKVIKR